MSEDTDKVYKCPVCNGTGMVMSGFYNTQSDYVYTQTCTNPYEGCRSCFGRGIVWRPLNEAY